MVKGRIYTALVLYPPESMKTVMPYLSDMLVDAFKRFLEDSTVSSLMLLADGDTAVEIKRTSNGFELAETDVTQPRSDIRYPPFLEHYLQ